MSGDHNVNQTYPIHIKNHIKMIPSTSYMKIFIETYGCSANQSNSEIMGGILCEEGHRLTSEENSDLIIINTCTVKIQTERKILKRLKELRMSRVPTLVTGCMTEVQKDRIEDAYPSASIVGLNEITKIKRAIKQIENGERAVMTDDEHMCMVNTPKTRINPAINIVQIAKGCLGDCSYCIVRSAKGSLQSYPVKDITDDIRKSLKEGCKEIWITAQDTGCYGFDTGVTLPALIRKITSMDGDFMIRLGMMNPKHVKKIIDDLLKSLKSEKVYRFIHLPVQSGSDRILDRMNRGYSIEDAYEIIDILKAEFPDITISTDIIVGFPGETEEDFDKTLEFVKRTRPDIINISRYGKRPLTRAENLEPVDGNDIKLRSKQLTELADSINIDNNERWVGWKGKVLFSEEGPKGGLIGRNSAYKQILVHSGKLGKTADVEITEARRGYLVGRCI